MNFHYVHYVSIIKCRSHLCHSGILEGGRQLLLPVHINVHETLSKRPLSWYMHHPDAVL